MSFHSITEKPRSRRRAQVFMLGLLSTPVGPIKVTIREISKAGAQVVGDQPIPSECRVQLQRGEMQILAHVAWARGKSAGLNFERPLTVSELERCMPRGIVRALAIEKE